MNILNIYHYRGDTLDANITIDNYVPASSDIITFGIRKTYDSPDALVQKSIDPTTMHLHLTTEETQNLPDEAVYDIQIIYSDEEGVSYTNTFVRGKIYCKKDVVRL